MHGLGNDFVVIDAISQRPRLTPETIQQICDRRFGVGCDQLLLVEHPTDPDIDFRYRIFNADGSEVENCGNGARCFASFVRDRRLTGRRSIRVQTSSGKMTLSIQDDGQVTVNMGAPILEPAKIPLDLSHLSAADHADAPQQASYTLEVNGQAVEFGCVSMGNPHAVITVSSTDNAPVAELGASIVCHPAFPNKVNVGFMQILSRAEINLRVFERGVGETLACGTGACAAVAAGIIQGQLSDQVLVHLPGGDLVIRWPGPGKSVLMTGPTATVYHGQLKL
jgi:diaminopimelate epimerase